MADIELVIKIPKELYKDIKEHGLCGFCSDREIVSKAISNSTPLPKGHGRLIDADELTKEIKGYISDTSNLHYNDLEEAEAFNSAYYNCLDEIEDASTIMEADRSEVLNVKIAVEDK